MYRLTAANHDSSDSDIEDNVHHASIFSTAEYEEWVDMRERCTNRCHPHYEDFGMIGAKVCDEWYISFAKFLYDMGEMPTSSPKKVDSPTANANNKYAYILERIDCTQPYNKSNCRWQLCHNTMLHFNYHKSNKVVPHSVSLTENLSTPTSHVTNAAIRTKFDLLETTTNMSAETIAPQKKSSTRFTSANICNMS